MTEWVVFLVKGHHCYKLFSPRYWRHSATPTILPVSAVLCVGSVWTASTTPATRREESTVFRTTTSRCAWQGWHKNWGACFNTSFQTGPNAQVRLRSWACPKHEHYSFQDSSCRSMRCHSAIFDIYLSKTCCLLFAADQDFLCSSWMLNAALCTGFCKDWCTNDHSKVLQTSNRYTDCTATLECCRQPESGARAWGGVELIFRVGLTKSWEHWD